MPPKYLGFLSVLGLPVATLQGRASRLAGAQGPRDASPREGSGARCGITGHVSWWGLEGNALAHCLSLHTIARPSGLLENYPFEVTVLSQSVLPLRVRAASRGPGSSFPEGAPRAPGPPELGVRGLGEGAAPAGISQPVCGAEAVWQPQGAGGDAGRGGRAAEDGPPGVPGHQGEWATR